MNEAVADSRFDEDTPALAKEAKRARLLSDDERRVVRLWWQRLTLSDAEARERRLPPPWPRGVRAVLRRCATPEAAVLTEGFRKLWQMLDVDAAEPADMPAYRRRDMQAWASVATVLAELGSEKSAATLGHRFGEQKAETGKPLVSELRFQQLQQSHTSDELTRRLRRGLALVGKEGISAVNLADDILLWHREQASDLPRSRRTDDRLAFRWAHDYFTTLATYQRDAK
ncbi:type I-E CRISPR-associated protein Cse2/CasB [Halomonas sp. YLGW01]|uniref:type I-E CRISPR-associated protein Cse2/CasB n=1 Tax=Halomonas sp. YLGW01 TaxID=2773308 RepID=UPI00177F3646|nr:type I-E CRISPR-associated protein Cse2/CasB [Halomonas sp. YLGW01]